MSFVRHSEMNRWGSVITPYRASRMEDVIERITEASRNPVNRQVGNVTGDLRNLGEFDLIAELYDAIESYNDIVRMDNDALDREDAIKRAINEFKSGSRDRRDYVRVYANPDYLYQDAEDMDIAAIRNFVLGELYEDMRKNYL